MGVSQIMIRYFAAAADAAGTAAENWPLAVDENLGTLRAGLIDRYGDAMARVLRSGSFLVDGTVVRDDSATITGDVVDVLPPFAGG